MLDTIIGGNCDRIFISQTVDVEDKKKINYSQRK